MRHRRKGRKLGRDASHRKALYANMCGALFEHGRIQTTEAKAKELRPIAEKLITLARKDPTDVAAQRHAVAFLRSKDAVKDAAEILIKYLSIFTDIDAADLALRPDGAAVEAAAPSAHGMENILIEELELGVRSYNCLKRVGIETIGDLISKSEAELAAIPNFGKKSIEEVKETLAAHGLNLKGAE